MVSIVTASMFTTMRNLVMLRISFSRVCFSQSAARWKIVFPKAVCRPVAVISASNFRFVATKDPERIALPDAFLWGAILQSEPLHFGKILRLKHRAVCRNNTSQTQSDMIAGDEIFCIHEHPFPFSGVHTSKGQSILQF